MPPGRWVCSTGSASEASVPITEIRIDLQSDTQTRPTPGMRQAMAEAAVGDEQRNEDPSTNRLLDMVKELFGKEDAVFLPSGTMCNQIAIMLHCRPGDEILADRTSHIFNLEGAGSAVFAGTQIRALDGERGVFTAAQVEAGIREWRRHTPRTRLIEVEQTANLGGGTVWPLETIRAVSRIAREHDLLIDRKSTRLKSSD